LFITVQANSAWLHSNHKEEKNMLLHKNSLTGLIMLTASVALPMAAHAGNDTSIKGDLRTNINQSMTDFIEQQTIDSRMYIYDAVSGELLNLTFEKLHTGIVKKGDFYVSCADFKDNSGRKVDIDFMVRLDDGNLITTQALVHSIAGNKRKYHLEK